MWTLSESFVIFSLFYYCISFCLSNSIAHISLFDENFQVCALSYTFLIAEEEKREIAASDHASAVVDEHLLERASSSSSEDAQLDDFDDQGIHILS